jgi:hypothetical protein
LSDVLADDRVPIVGPDGKLVSVPKVNYGKAVEAGYRLQTAEEQERFHEQLKKTGQQQ